MYERIHLLSRADFDKIHQATLEIFKDVGIAFHEPEALEIFSGAGARVDGNVVFIEAGLVDKALESAPSEFQIEGRNPEKTVSLMDDMNRQLGLLIENQIHHVDLHPGNVLIDGEENLFIIDFDKARTTPQNRQKLKKKYIRRWQRAVNKYQLPAALNNIENI